MVHLGFIAQPIECHMVFLSLLAYHKVTYFNLDL